MQADVFCRVIDNFGDIGVTWRLVRQLQREHNWQIRLWVDDLKSFQRLEPRVGLLPRQHLNGIEIIDWTPATDLHPKEVIIAMFSCDLPAVYLTQLHESSRPKSLWINLEYLTAEDWVEGCHRLPSLRSDDLISHFFFPGFTAKTGGLPRESDLIAQRDKWQTDHAAQRIFLEKLGLSERAIAARFPLTPHTLQARLVNLFCYDNAPVNQLIEALSADQRQTVLLIPEGIHPQLLSEQCGQLFIERIPFLPQTEYDKVLWMADLNFVRGEDSIVRGIWAGKPLIWQIYPQTENTHLQKLQAWLARTGLPEDICNLIASWNPESNEPANKIIASGYENKKLIGQPSKNISFSIGLQQQLLASNFEIWQQQAYRFSTSQSDFPDLATALTDFCLSKQNG